MGKKSTKKSREARNQEVSDIAADYLQATERLKESTCPDEILEIKTIQNDCIIKLKHLVSVRTNKYKKFSNHEDLEQDGMEALLLALRTYDPEKGIFGWWADKYISTRVSRSANCHSTIRYPLKVAKEVRPYKTNVIPTIIETSLSALERVESEQMAEIISKAIDTLPEKNQKVVNMTYGFNGHKPNTISFVLTALSISRSQYVKLIQESKEVIKEYILSLDSSFEK